MSVEFREWPKIARWNRDVTITEKIDGTNAAIVVLPSGDVFAQSRSKVITIDTDNHGFARFVADYAHTLAEGLGEGYHFGEWFGSGVQKRAGYGLERGEKHFALFNVGRWLEDPFVVDHPLLETVPVLWQGTAECLEGGIAKSMRVLREYGSFVPSAKGKPEVRPEGIVIYHHAANMSFKMTLEKDDEWKGKTGG